MSSTRQEKLTQRMAALGISDDDIIESFTRSSGPGGQNVNKTSSAVVVAHRPTGLQVRCEKERSQAQNRLKARELLVDKISEFHRVREAEARAAAEKQRRRTRKRSQSAQNRILHDKALQSARKQRRRRPPEE